MNIENFKKLLKEHRIPILNVKINRNLSYSGFRPENFLEYEDIKSLTEYMPFNCDFRGSYCRSERPQSEMRVKGNKMCCCKTCPSYIGYLGFVDLDDLEYYADNFSEKTGFWRENGCVLDRKKRSSLCVTYTCNRDISRQLRSLKAVLIKIERVFIGRYNIEKKKKQKKG